MNSALRAAALLGAFLLIPILPFLWLGESFETSLLDAVRQPLSAPKLCAWVLGLLSADILLPVPSSALITFAGGKLGWKLATIVSLAGLSIGSIAGFAIARRWGQPILSKLGDSAALSRIGHWVQKHGVTALILTRALPILAEACVLLLGSSRMPWSRFLPALVASNFCVALSYSACGAYFSKDNGFILAVVSSGALPLIAALVIRGKSRPDSSAP